MCRYGDKRRFDTRDGARAGARTIKAAVEARGGVYDTLHPYACPDGPTQGHPAHWHLSHFHQGTATCPVCSLIVRAWRADNWVISGHYGCPGEGRPGLYPREDR